MQTNKYILGKSGAIGSALSGLSPIWSGISRSQFADFVCDDLSQYDCEIINSALLSNSDLRLLVESLNKSGRSHTLHHLSSVAVEAQDSQYSKRKLYEENYLNSCLEDNVKLIIYRLDLPLVPRLSKCGYGYWNTLNLERIKFIFVDRTATVNELNLDHDFNVINFKLMHYLDKNKPFVIKIGFLKRVFRMLPAKNINKILGFFNIGLFR